MRGYGLTGIIVAWLSNLTCSCLPLLSVGGTSTGVPGMDPVYILHVDGENRETEVLLLWGGTVLFDGLVRHGGEDDRCVAATGNMYPSL
jgi:hypothetical protein